MVVPGREFTHIAGNRNEKIIVVIDERYHYQTVPQIGKMDLPVIINLMNDDRNLAEAVYFTSSPLEDEALRKKRGYYSCLSRCGIRICDFPEIPFKERGENYIDDGFSTSDIWEYVATHIDSCDAFIFIGNGRDYEPIFRFISSRGKRIELGALLNRIFPGLRKYVAEIHDLASEKFINANLEPPRPREYTNQP